MHPLDECVDLAAVGHVRRVERGFPTETADLLGELLALLFEGHVAARHVGALLGEGERDPATDSPLV